MLNEIFSKIQTMHILVCYHADHVGKIPIKTHTRNEAAKKFTALGWLVFEDNVFCPNHAPSIRKEQQKQAEYIAKYGEFGN